MWKSESVGLSKERKKSYAAVAKIYSENESSIPEIVKKAKEVCACFAVTPQIVKVNGHSGW